MLITYSLFVDHLRLLLIFVDLAALSIKSVHLPCVGISPHLSCLLHSERLWLVFKYFRETRSLLLLSIGIL